MRFNNILILSMLIMSILLISGCGDDVLEDVTFTNKTLEINGNSLFIEVANESAQWMKGLSGREELCSNCGMLFVFENTQVYHFWMKDTYFPLDIIYLDERGTIVNIVQAEPCIPEPCEGEVCEDIECKEYSSNFPVKYVLEINQGYAEELGLAKWGSINLS